MQTRKINKKKKTIHTKRRNFKSVKKVTFCNVIRNNNGGCLWLGGENDPSIFFGFNNKFDTFNYMTNVINYGSESNNGFVYKIDYSKEGYKSSAILKSSSSSDSDNLYYEYFVGKNFINRMNLQYSCFVQTYNIYISGDEKFRKRDQQYKNLSGIDFNTHFHKLDQYTINDEHYCLHSKWLSILIETVPNAVSLGKYLGRKIDIIPIMNLKKPITNRRVPIYFEKTPSVKLRPNINLQPSPLRKKKRYLSPTVNTLILPPSQYDNNIPAFQPFSSSKSIPLLNVFSTPKNLPFQNQSENNNNVKMSVDSTLPSQSQNQSENNNNVKMSVDSTLPSQSQNQSEKNNHVKMSVDSTLPLQSQNQSEKNNNVKMSVDSTLPLQSQNQSKKNNNVKMSVDSTLPLQSQNQSKKNNNVKMSVKQSQNQSKKNNLKKSDPFTGGKINSYNEKELTQILFQIYGPLSQLSQNFTHYDLHLNNVLLYQLKNDEYMKMKYVYPDNSVIEFNTSYIAKIIDYGRCFFHSDVPGIISPSQFIDVNLKGKSNCHKFRRYDRRREKLGNYSGFSYLVNDEIDDENHYISSKTRNYTHDLRLLHSIRIRYNITDHLLKNMLQRIHYTHAYGSKEKPSQENICCNVMDAGNYLSSMMKDESFKTYYSDVFDTKKRKSIGTLTMYVNNTFRAMEYTP